jgi:hypothetical protein
MQPSDRSDEVITNDNRIVGCRGRVLLAVLVLAALVLILAATLLYRLFTWTPPVPRRAAIDSNPSLVAINHPRGPSCDFLQVGPPVGGTNLVETLPLTLV